MTPEECAAYCREVAAPPGSDLYYATLFAPDATRRALHALHALAGEIVRIPREVSDPGVARLKLQWWREECRRLAEGRAEHPAARALAQAAAPSQPPALTALIDAVEEDLDRRPPPSTQAATAAALRREGSLWRQCAILSGCRDAATPAAVEKLGGAFGLYNALRDLRADLRAGVLRLPTDEPPAPGAPADAISSPPGRERVAALAVRTVGQARLLILEGVAALPPGDRWSQLPALVMTEIVVKTMQEDQADGFRVLDRRVSLTPLRKLWAALRTRHRERRLHRRTGRA